MSQDAPDTAPGVQWTPSIDKMLADWCDEAKCFEWMNAEAYSRFSRRSLGLSIAANAIISFSGIANLVVGNLTDGSSSSIVFGCISIVIGVVNMVQDKFDLPTLANNFKAASKRWSDITIKIEEQLAIPPSGRKDCGTFLKYIKQDINAVSENSSSIPKDIRDKCFTKFNAIPNFNVPDICGQLEHTSIYVETNQQPLLSTVPV